MVVGAVGKELPHQHALELQAFRLRRREHALQLVLAHAEKRSHLLLLVGVEDDDGVLRSVLGRHAVREERVAELLVRHAADQRRRRATLEAALARQLAVDLVAEEALERVDAQERHRLQNADVRAEVEAQVLGAELARELLQVLGAAARGVGAAEAREEDVLDGLHVELAALRNGLRHVVRKHAR
eukprot:987134-Rhodomonas_salina.1